MSLTSNKKMPIPIESYTTNEGVLIHVFEQKYFKNILNYYDKNTYWRKGKTDDWFLLINDPKNASVFNDKNFEKNTWEKK
jgi:hypothetical protein